MPFHYITNERQAKEGGGFSHEKKTVPEKAGICQTWFRTVMFPVFRQWDNTVLSYMWIRDFHGEGRISALIDRLWLSVGDFIKFISYKRETISSNLF